MLSVAISAHSQLSYYTLQVATANTYAQMFSNLPSCGKPTRLLIYDLHTLQNRFYLHGEWVGG